MDQMDNRMIIVRGPLQGQFKKLLKGMYSMLCVAPALLPGVGKVPVELQPAAVQLARPGHARYQRGVKQYILPLWYSVLWSDDFRSRLIVASIEAAWVL
jgi:hypothetical protein